MARVEHNATEVNDPDSQPASDETAASPIQLGPLSDHIGYLLRRAQVRIFQEFYDRLGDLSLSPAQFSVLMVIAANPGLKQSEVASVLGIKRANIVGLIDALESRQFAVRHADQTDRRSYALRLTDAGTVILGQANHLLTDLEHRITEQLGEADQSKLIDILTKLQKISFRPEPA